MTRDFWPLLEPRKQVAGRSQEVVLLDARSHGVALARPFTRALALTVLAALLLAHGWPLSVPGAAVLGAAAVLALVAAWRWERTRIVVTPGRLVVAYGTLRRRTVSLALAPLGAVEVEQSLLGGLLGYGTLVAGDLEIPYVPEPAYARRIVERAAASAPAAGLAVPLGLAGAELRGVAPGDEHRRRRPRRPRLATAPEADAHRLHGRPRKR